MNRIFPFTFMFLLVIVGSIFYHEQIHKDIYVHDGCSDVKRGVGLGYAYTKCLDKSYTPSINAESLNSFNEIITYNNYSLLMMVFVVGLFLVGFKDE